MLFSTSFVWLVCVCAIVWRPIFFLLLYNHLFVVAVVFCIYSFNTKCRNNPIRSRWTKKKYRSIIFVAVVVNHQHRTTFILEPLQICVPYTFFMRFFFRSIMSFNLHNYCHSVQSTRWCWWHKPTNGDDNNWQQ